MEGASLKVIVKVNLGYTYSIGLTTRGLQKMVNLEWSTQSRSAIAAHLPRVSFASSSIASIESIFLPYLNS